ncbi:MAG: glycoside hydrolase family 127 protein [Verrucomicrobiia bacterium]
MKRIVASVAFISTLSLIADAATPSKDYPIQPVPFTAVHVQDSFWSPRMETNRAVTVWYDFKRCEETGRIDNFAKAAELMKGEFKGIPYDDSDVYKVIEGAAYSLALKPDPKLDKYLDDLIAKIAAAQEPDGYLYTARRLFTPEKMPKMSAPQRWTNLGASHELYNVGHLYEAAVAHFQATGKRTLLDVATRNADMLCKTFGPGPDQLKEPPGHQEIEIGLCKLYRVTGQRRYLDLARFYVELRGREDTHKLRGPNQQDHKPIYEQDEAVGHAVRAAYYYAGVADVAALTGDKKLIAAIDRLWENVVSKKLYLTGGIGATRHGEAFGANYELPNKTAYNETCAAIANALWNERMFLLHGDAKYLDVLERTIYNGFLSGVALTGTEFFYPNPLASDARYKRSPWFGTACCPVNVVRFLPELAGYIYATRGGEAFVNLFAGSTAKLTLGKTAVELRQQTRYPWDGRVMLTVTPEKKAAFTLNVRIPGWARNEPVPSDLYRYDALAAVSDRDLIPTLKLNGKPVALAMKKGFAQIKRTWQAGDTVELELPMPVRRVVAHPAVKEDVDKFAVERGPLVYCAEGADNDGKVLAKVPGADVWFETQERRDLFGGIVTVKIVPKGAGDALTLIPNCLWENRGPNEMSVWFRTKPAPPEPWAVSFCHPSDSAEACFDGQLPKNSNDHNIPRMTWWDHKGTAEWVERTFDKPTKFSAAEVYWFDDTGKGGCRVPQSWKLLYKDGAQWKHVANATDFGVKRDQFIRITFTPVTTTALRLEVQLQPKFSGGILEWRMGE